VAQDALAVEKRRAGAEYLAALRSLGLDPEALFWARDTVVGEDVLILVTSLFDFAGPLELSGLLFKAYNLAATPREVDPFILRLHSPNHAAIREMAHRFGDGRRIKLPILLALVQPVPGVHEIRLAALSMGADVTAYADAVYTFDLSERPAASVDASRRWRRFQKHIDKLAA
jgi:hypothetical protein